MAWSYKHFCVANMNLIAKAMTWKTYYTRMNQCILIKKIYWPKRWNFLKILLFSMIPNKKYLFKKKTWLRNCKKSLISTIMKIQVFLILKMPNESWSSMRRSLKYFYLLRKWILLYFKHSNMKIILTITRINITC